MDEFYSLGFLLHRASVALSKSLNTALENSSIDLPHSQYIVLRCLYHHDGISQLKIATLLSKDAAAIKRTVDNLEKKGLVARHPVRNLKNSVCITDKGRSLMPEALKIGERVISEALKGFDKADSSLLQTMLAGIYTNLESKQL